MLLRLLMPTCDSMILMQNRGSVPKEASRVATSSTNSTSSASLRDRYPYVGGLPFPLLAQRMESPLNVSDDDKIFVHRETGDVNEQTIFLVCFIW